MGTYEESCHFKQTGGPRPAPDTWALSVAQVNIRCSGMLTYKRAKQT